MKDHGEAKDRYRIRGFWIRVFHRDGLGGGGGQGNGSCEKHHDDGDEDESKAEEAAEVDFEIWMKRFSIEIESWDVS